MNFALLYVLYRVFLRAAAFFTHWYRGGFEVARHWFLELFSRLNRAFALRATLYDFLGPLRGRSAGAFIVGAVCRAGFVAAGAVFSAGFFLFVCAAYGAWALIPIALLLRGLPLHLL